MMIMLCLLCGATILYWIYQQYAFTCVSLIYVSVSVFVSSSVSYVVLFDAFNVFTVIVAAV